MTEQSVAEVFTFPTDPAEFENDDRISFSKLDNKFIAVQESDGTEFEFDHQLKRWIPVADEDEEAFIQQHQDAYGNAQESGADSSAQPSNGKKRKQDQVEDQDNHGSSSASNKQRKNKKQNTQKQPPQNRAIYVTGLPLDVTVDEVAEVFGRKCGVIAEEIDSGRPRIKLYSDAEGNFKGDALIVFFKPPSVEMAIMLLDDSHFRYSDTGLGSGKMRVQAAESSYKKTQYTAEGEAGGEAKDGGAAGSSRQQQNNGGKGGGGKDREKVIKKTQKLDAKLADWSDDEAAYVPPEQRTGKKDKMVILKHMFTLQELEDDPAALLEIKEDIREECEKLGEVTNVVLYDLEEDGVVSVKYKKPESAAACVELMDGRAFGGQRVEAYIPSGRLKFQRSKDNNDDAGEDD
ncbi:hypothetical protein KVR01_005197 [Diaporthe batatas]|uniref:uncharacterized protein n=1 Tax=Diaporthe batatas TaxID=748121 RepID=UPI001D04A9D0|nr:uncharacterized protein KVR01_005197 [Diaporthe batatas]KAG8164922.1 hypothetical protein KVR01_005197 [Diaporthe batatas]